MKWNYIKLEYFFIVLVLVASTAMISGCCTFCQNMGQDQMLLGTWTRGDEKMTFNADETFTNMYNGQNFQNGDGHGTWSKSTQFYCYDLKYDNGVTATIQIDYNNHNHFSFIGSGAEYVRS